MAARVYNVHFMIDFEKPLAGIELITPAPEKIADEAYSQGYQKVADFAGRLGANITISDGSRDERLLNDPDVFTLVGNRTMIREREAALFNLPAAFKIRRPKTIRFDEPEASKPRLPFVLAVRNASSGIGKYFIEEPEQLQTVQMMFEDHAALNPSHGFEIREWIPTPSDYYTSYRVITGPTGEVLAAGLLYNNHKDLDARIPPIRQQEPLLRSTSSIDYWGKSFSAALEDPSSDYYLNSRNICSNIDQGGKCIPLRETPLRPLSSNENDILAAHNIDPDRPVLPDDVAGQAGRVGRWSGKVAGLVIGVDFVQHRDTGESYLLDINTGPGETVWLECRGGRYVTPLSTVVVDMNIDSLRSIVAHR